MDILKNKTTHPGRHEHIVVVVCATEVVVQSLSIALSFPVMYGHGGESRPAGHTFEMSKDYRVLPRGLNRGAPPLGACIVRPVADTCPTILAVTYWLLS